MSEELLKYKTTGKLSVVNELYEKGYRLHTVLPVISEYGNTWGYQYILSLSEPSKYDDVTKFKKINITFEEQEVPEGWEIIHHTSKEMILVKKLVSED